MRRIYLLTAGLLAGVLLSLGAVAYTQLSGGNGHDAANNGHDAANVGAFWRYMERAIREAGFDPSEHQEFVAASVALANANCNIFDAENVENAVFRMVREADDSTTLKREIGMIRASVEYICPRHRDAVMGVLDEARQEGDEHFEHRVLVESIAEGPAPTDASP